MTISEIVNMVTPFVSIGFLLGCLPMVVGLGIMAIINIIKSI